MKNETVYPEWVQQQRIKGTTVKKVGNTYYLYKRTSKRIPGKKYPQPVDTYPECNGYCYGSCNSTASDYGKGK